MKARVRNILFTVKIFQEQVSSGLNCQVINLPQTELIMSASPSSTSSQAAAAPAAPAPTTSNKRAHEDSTNAPEAKRPNLDLDNKQEGNNTASTSKTASPGPDDVKSEPETTPTGKKSPSPEADQKTPDVKRETHDEQGDVNVPDAPQHQQQQQHHNNHQENYVPIDESKWIHIRAIISSQEAATVIGKGGENVTLIRRMSAAKCTVSDYARGAVERILTVSGSVDAVAKVIHTCLAPSFVH